LGPESKGKKKNHKSGNLGYLPQYLGGRRSKNAVMERERVGHRPPRKLKKQEAQAVEGMMVVARNPTT
jgi:hypothetical protein